MKKSFRKLIPAILMVLLSASLMGTSTFAWFSMNSKVTVTGMKVRTRVSDDLLIAPSTTTEKDLAADNKFDTSLVQDRTALLEPVSTTDGEAFFYTSTKNVAKSGDARNNDYVAYDEGNGVATFTATAAQEDFVLPNATDTDPTSVKVNGTLDGSATYDSGTKTVTVSSPCTAGDIVEVEYATTLDNSATADKTAYDAAFNNNYAIGTVTTDNVAYGYVDYAFDIKATNTQTYAQQLRLTNLNLVYGNTQTKVEKAFRIAVFVADRGATGVADIEGTYSNTIGELKNIYRVGGARYFTTTETYAIPDSTAADSTAGDGPYPYTIDADHIIYGSTTTATNGTTKWYLDVDKKIDITSSVSAGTKAFTAGTNSAVKTVSTLNTIESALDAAAALAALPAGQTNYYKVVVRMWLEGEDTTCNNDTFAKLTDEWALDLTIQLVETADTTTVGKQSVKYINESVTTTKANLVGATLTGDTVVIANVTYTKIDTVKLDGKDLYVQGGTLTDSSRIFTITDSLYPVEVTNQCRLCYVITIVNKDAGITVASTYNYYGTGSKDITATGMTAGYTGTVEITGTGTPAVAKGADKLTISSITGDATITITAP